MKKANTSSRFLVPICLLFRGFSCVFGVIEFVFLFARFRGRLSLLCRRKSNSVYNVARLRRIFIYDKIAFDRAFELKEELNFVQISSYQIIHLAPH